MNIRKFVEKYVELRPGQTFDEAVIQFSQVALWVKDNNTQMLAFFCR